MIDKVHGKYHVICDICEAAAPKTFDTWDDALAYKRDRKNGWKYMRSGSE